MIDAAHRASAHKVIAVMPYFGWARQDRKDRPRVPIGAKLVANLLVAAGVDRVMTMDLHADQIQGFFDVPVDALYASGVFVPYIKSLNMEDLSIASPDMGGAKRAHSYAKHLQAPIIISHKERAKANVVGSMTAIGEVEGRNIIIVDDMIDTAGTICMAANMLILPHEKQREQNSFKIYLLKEEWAFEDETGSTMKIFTDIETAREQFKIKVHNEKHTGCANVWKNEKNLIEEFEKLPSIGHKTAVRLAFHILNAPEEDAESCRAFPRRA